MSIDPAVDAALRLALALLFFSAAGHKLRGSAAFRAAVAGYGLLPRALVAPASQALVLAEIAASILLVAPLASAGWPPGAREAGPVAALALLALYSLAIASGLARGLRGIDCGCAGPAAAAPLGPALLLRNALLALGALACLAPTGARPLVWVDVLTVAGSVAVLSALYASAGHLLAAPPALPPLRTS